MIPRLFRC